MEDKERRQKSRLSVCGSLFLLLTPRFLLAGDSVIDFAKDGSLVIGYSSCRRRSMTAILAQGRFVVMCLVSWSFCCGHFFVFSG